MEIPKILEKEILTYCSVNNITDTDGFIIKLIRQSFTIEKYGSVPVNQELQIKKTVELVTDKSKVVKKQKTQLIKIEKADEADAKKGKNDLYDEN